MRNPPTPSKPWGCRTSTPAWAGRPIADKTQVETQTPHPLSLRTRDDGRAALARAFEEAATMPGTLLPHETLDELTEMAGRIHDEVMRLDDADMEITDAA